MTKVLVIIMSAGENELEDVQHAIDNQVNVDFDVVHIKNLPNKKAHIRLYKTIEDNSDNYQYFVKVDGDMVINSTKTLSEMIQIFEDDLELDHVAFSVLDWCSQKAIIGMHVFSNRCRWPDLNDNLFVDPSPVYPGRSRIVWDKPAPVAVHSPNPSILQAIQFGYHRGMKIVQRDRRIPCVSRAIFQYDLMYQVYRQLCLQNDLVRLAVMFGLEAAIKSKKESRFESKDHKVFLNLLSEFEPMDKNALRVEIDKRWQGPWQAQFFSPVKFSIWFRFVLFSIVKKIAGGFVK
ncbi:hypothetical protein BZG00_10515 [Salinivibrio kushneri]|uniref:Glycosyltransferase n=1 Tax=Salinivibrio kushneri TaxID=1908198 RepID=A0AB36JWE5_9GAMM|nr:hypothetical protein [Salinivibrio kushneri]OOE39314.1 hypothetical protein BZG00_10515 [Salinivibrio kushneri]QCP02454.1 hypothetical protein FCN78_08660 [Salinivibrio kushneri]